MSYKTTKKDFTEFKKECEFWIEYFGLKNWNFLFLHEPHESARAFYWVQMQGRLATIELSTEWNLKPNKYEVQECAFHEVCEIMLSVLSVPAREIFDAGFIEGKTHDIIRRLENTIFKEYRG